MPGATRTVSVTLQARTSSYIASMRTAGKATTTAFAATDKRLRANREHLNTLATGFGIVGLAAAAGVGKAIKSFADFDEAMSAVQAATHETEGNMKRLREAALQAGIDTKFSATEAAAGVEQLAKAGVATKDILGGGLLGALDLAAAGELDVATAAETAATAMVQFGLSGKQIPHLADLLSAGASKAQGDVEDLALAMKQGGLVASQFGLSVEETVGTMTAFASAGLIGSDAGTSFKQMLLRLGNPSGKAAELMKRLGIETYDAQGNFIGITKLAGELRKELGDLTPAQRNSALATIFGSDAIRAANVLYKQGEKGIQGWINKVDDQGFAAETAAIKMDNLKGDLEQLSGSLETAFIGAGSGGDLFARQMVQNVRKVVDAFNELTPAQQQAALTTTAIVGAAALGTAGLLKMIVVVNDTRAALEALTGRAITLRAALGAIAGAAAVVGTAIAAVELGKLHARATVANVSIDNLSESLKSFGEGGDLGSVGIELFANQSQILGNKVDTTGESLNRFSILAEAAFGDTWSARAERMLNFGEDMEQVREITGQLDSALAKLAATDPTKAAQGFEKFAGILHNQGATQAEINALFPKYVAAADQASTAAKANAAAHKVVDAAMRGEKVSAEALNSALKQLSEGALGTEQANIAFRQSINGIADAAEANGKKLKGNSDAALANRSAITQAAQSALSYSDAIEKAGGSQKEVNATLQASRRILVDQIASAFGISKKAASEYVTEVLGIPKVAKTDIKENANSARKHVKNYHDAINAVPRSHTTRFTAKTSAGLRAIRGYAAAIAGIPSRKTTRVTVSTSGRGGIEKLLPPGGRRAHGGPVAAGRTYLVGEEGPELFTATGTGRITPADQTSRLLGALDRNTSGLMRAERFVGGDGAGAAGATGGPFEGELFLDSGQFLGMVRGTVKQMNGETRRHALAGAGAAR